MTLCAVCGSVIAGRTAVSTDDMEDPIMFVLWPCGHTVPGGPERRVVDVVEGGDDLVGG